MSDLDDKDFGNRAPYIQKIMELEAALADMRHRQESTDTASKLVLYLYDKLRKENEGLRGALEWAAHINEIIGGSAIVKDAMRKVGDEDGSSN